MLPHQVGAGSLSVASSQVREEDQGSQTPGNACPPDWPSVLGTASLASLASLTSRALAVSLTLFRCGLIRAHKPSDYVSEAPGEAPRHP